MTSLKLFLSFCHLDIPSLLIAAALIVFHYITNGYRFNRKSYLYLSGVLLFLISTLSPLSYLAKYYLFSAHMTKHIIILLIVPPMLVSSTNPDFLKKIFKNKKSRGIGKFLFYPIVSWTLGVGSMWVWHIPSLYLEMEKSPLLQLFQMISLLILGVIFIYPVYTPISFRKLHPLKCSLYLFTACVGCTVLGILITFAPAGIYTTWSTIGNNPAILNLIRERWGINPSTDQQMGGLIMWVPACFVYLTNVLITISKWYRLSEQDISVDEDELLTRKLNLP
jgi:cytochrome c oxidase assembly factor CtaG